MQRQEMFRDFEALFGESFVIIYLQIYIYYWWILIFIHSILFSVKNVAIVKKKKEEEREEKVKKLLAFRLEFGIAIVT